ncbi:MAG: nucleoside deaminase [Candidatus Izemoplasmatales bacterium]|nr:nucleoside deaminase [Candidatus Izemoplasmatales bacterium]
MIKPTYSSQEIMQKAIDKAQMTMNENIGGPFGAVIVNQTGAILAITSNSVLADHDPTAHAEIKAIREAAQAIKSHDLSGCTLYTTAYPCPMCLGAIMWANIKNVVYGCRPKDADEIGFRDDFMYDFIQSGMNDSTLLTISEEHRDECRKLFKEYQAKHKELY